MNKEAEEKTDELNQNIEKYKASIVSKKERLLNLELKLDKQQIDKIIMD